MGGRGSTTVCRSLDIIMVAFKGGHPAMEGYIGVGCRFTGYHTRESARKERRKQDVGWVYKVNCRGCEAGQHD